MTEAGSDSTMTGIFPPRPNTIYGALRSAFIHHHISFEEFREGTHAEVKKWMGTPDKLGDFRLDYCGLYYKQELLLPLPLDHQVMATENDGNIAYPLSLQMDENPSSQGSGWRLMSNRKEKTKGSANQYVKIEQWKTALLGVQPFKDVISVNELLEKEQKIGIALDYNERRTKENYLYNMTKLRFKDDGGLIVYTPNSPDFTKIPFARIGGENRPWSIKQEQGDFSLWDSTELEKIRQQILETKLAKLVLLSPAIWEQGSRPLTFDGTKLTLPNGIHVNWLTAAIGRPSLYGGWDIVKHRPKKRCFMVPEGSIIYISLQENQAMTIAEQVDSLLQLVNGFSLTDQGAQEGFGFAVIAAANMD